MSSNLGEFTPGLISILTPTRGRPDNVRRLVESIFSNAENPTNIEILFYVDQDDATFPESLIDKNVKVIVGPRLWLSIMQNVLYANARGEIIMYAGDDIVLSTKNWDQIVRNEFEKVEDKICVVYGNDNATHGQSIAIHAFLHRNWVNAVGCWVPAGRGLPYDVWITELGRNLDRLIYLPALEIEHLHYRQGEGKAEFDETYKIVHSAARSWMPKITYKLLKRERRIDFILLSEVMKPPPKIQIDYLISEFIVKFRGKLKLDQSDVRRIRTIPNYKIVLVMGKHVFLKILKKIFIFVRLKRK
jgi:hypothetical protein